MTLAFRHIAVLITVLVLPACAGLGLKQNFAPAAAVNPGVGEAWTYQVVNGYNKLPVNKQRHQVVSAAAERFETRITEEGPGPGLSRTYVPGWNPDSGVYPVGLAMAGFWNGIPPGAPVRYAPPLPLFRFPLTPGKSWRETVTVSDPATGKQVPVQVVASVDGMETVTVPAGQFQAVKVSRNLYYQDAEWWRGPVFQQMTDWYAPSVNRVVRHWERSQYVDHTRRGFNDS
ncbi:MAG TPA: hypothetical protein VLC55_12415, partial [Burkholderiales bacterium]|nr:hypothetical protein [Burkholderiales bacterium]